MNYFSMKADQNRDERLNTKNFLFATIPGIDDPEKLEGIGMGMQIEKFNDILNKKEDKEIYKVFKEYIKTKRMNVQILKEPQEWQKQVDRLCKEENNLISISFVENKIPPTDIYYSVKLEELKQDFGKFLQNYNG
ncbi:hypothetical protein [Candidatus Clostridium radicumherbarum]|uniref:Uncharacterized protein n=1 Tax=Candidatus Clostridium radicumherbarum TaxID=3381662 RepID=A0ABW8U158_9CLOT